MYFSCDRIHISSLFFQRLNMVLPSFPDYKSGAQTDKERNNKKVYLKLEITAFDILPITENLYSSYFPSGY